MKNSGDVFRHTPLHAGFQILWLDKTRASDQVLRSARCKTLASFQLCSLQILFRCSGYTKAPHSRRNDFHPSPPPCYSVAWFSHSLFPSVLLFCRFLGDSYHLCIQVWGSLEAVRPCLPHSLRDASSHVLQQALASAAERSVNRARVDPFLVVPQFCREGDVFRIQVTYQFPLC